METLKKQFKECDMIFLEDTFNLIEIKNHKMSYISIDYIKRI